MSVEAVAVHKVQGWTADVGASSASGTLKRNWLLDVFTLLFIPVTKSLKLTIFFFHSLK